MMATVITGRPPPPPTSPSAQAHPHGSAPGLEGLSMGVSMVCDLNPRKHRHPFPLGFYCNCNCNCKSNRKSNRKSYPCCLFRALPMEKPRMFSALAGQGEAEASQPDRGAAMVATVDRTGAAGTRSDGTGAGARELTVRKRGGCDAAHQSNQPRLIYGSVLVRRFGS
jgi:hypothetical protein